MPNGLLWWLVEPPLLQRLPGWLYAAGVTDTEFRLGPAEITTRVAACGNPGMEHGDCPGTHDVDLFLDFW